MKRFAFASVLALSTLWFAAPAPAAERTLTYGSLRVTTYGTAGKPALVLIPGLTCGPWEWSNEIARFSPSYRIYALTLPGFDGAPAIKTPLFDTVSDDFWTFVQQQHVEKPVIVGHSIGGTLAIMLAEQHPDRLRSVIAVDGLPVFPGTQMLSTDERAAMAKRSLAQMQQLSPQQFAASQQRSIAYMVTAPKDADAIARAAANADPAATARWVSEDLALDLRPNLKKATLPILEIAPFDPGVDAQLADAGAKQQYYASLLQGAPNAKIQVIAPSRHFIMYDRSATLDAAIAAAAGPPPV